MQKITDIYAKNKEDAKLVTGVPRNFPEIEGVERKAFNRKVVIRVTRLMRKKHGQT